ncbi:MAG TPA: dihydrolipoamide acetyltransferase family protein [Solirubrobacteraceae bacterium]|jgi:pyruvate dehydrogenase E2 component (dihydrolipoamide acetyltransferase)|nr:dihydrolipoamide acetyltransferase family protein [Solirubrobacteraceae bacterium]
MPALVMPRLSDTMEEGTIVAWLVADGATVSLGEEVVEIEGDKATTAGSATAEGTLKILCAEGETVSVREPIAWIGDDAPAAAEHDEAAQPVAPQRAAAASEPARAEVSASPVARRLAAELGVDLAAISGSGPAGRIVREDVESFAAASPAEAATAEPAAAEAPEAVDTAKGAPVRVALSRTQELIARRMAASKATIPDFQLWVSIDMEAAIARRDHLREQHPPGPSINDQIVHAVGVALGEFPNVNGSYREGEFEHHPRVNVAVAVAADDALYAPTVLDADTRSLEQIAASTRELTALAREGKLTPAQTAGATFTVSNLGMFGVTGFRALVSAPQSGILAVGAIEPRVVAVEGEARIRRCLTATLSVDHRIVYGAEGAAFLARVRELLEAKEEQT